MKKTKPLDTSLAMTSLALGTFGIIWRDNE